MKILVTGSRGFLATNLIEWLKNKNHEIILYDRSTTEKDFDIYCKEAEFVFHLAGVNRNVDNSEFIASNIELTERLLSNLKKNNNKCSILFSSSIHSNSDNIYGSTKKSAESILEKYSNLNSINVYIYRLPNLFGKWGKPNYNSVIATFCHNISRNIPLKVNDRNTKLQLAYIDQVCQDFLSTLEYDVNKSDLEIDKFKYLQVKKSHTISLGEIVDILNEFKETRSNFELPNLNSDFRKELYSTYLSYLPEDKFSYEIKENKDERGSFSEIFKMKGKGQISINVTKPGFTKGNHWHNTKVEKFIVVSGFGVIRFRKLNSSEIIEYHVNEDKIYVVDIPPGYSHNIENVGDKDLVTLMWANESFDLKNPDTYFLGV